MILILTWIEQGYTDTISSISRIKEALNNRSELKSVMFEQKNEESKMFDSSIRMQEIMEEVRRK